MGGRFNTCDYPYCGKPATVLAKKKRGCTHEVCKKHARHSCAKIDAWRRESPGMNFYSASAKPIVDDLESFSAAELVDMREAKAEDMGRRTPRISTKDWSRVIER